MPVLVRGHGDSREKLNKRNIVLEELANYSDKVGVLDTGGVLA